MANKKKTVRKNQYDPKLKINGSFDEVLRLSAQPLKKQGVKKTDKKK